MKKDRPIKRYYYYAKIFTKMTWLKKYLIGYDLGILDESDSCMATDELEELVFTQVIRGNVFEEFKEYLYVYKDTEVDITDIPYLNDENPVYW